MEELARALAVDRFGRLAGVRGLCYASTSYRDFCSAEVVAQIKCDCLLLDSHSATSDATFWLPADAVPRSGLEYAAPMQHPRTLAASCDS